MLQATVGLTNVIKVADDDRFIHSPSRPPVSHDDVGFHVLGCRVLFFASFFFCHLLAPEEDHFCRKLSCSIALCFVPLVSTFSPKVCSSVTVNSRLDVERCGRTKLSGINNKPYGQFLWTLSTMSTVR